jgi:large subunit ribosomal protein L5
MAEEKKSKGGKVGKAEAKSTRGGGNVSFDVVEGRPTRLAGKTRVSTHYDEKVRPALVEKFGYTSVMQAPRFVKIVVNMGVGRATQQKSLLDGAVTDLQIITGQKPLVTKAKKSIAGFKLREGQAIGAKVTLRGDRMWEFYDRLVSLAIPRIRDFRGMSTDSFDGRGNYTFGVTEQLIFPEIDYDKIDTVRGMDITIVTTGVTDDQGRALLRALGFPFSRSERSE